MSSQENLDKTFQPARQLKEFHAHHGRTRA